MAKDFEIFKLMNLCEKDRYANTVAGFEAIDVLEQLEIPKKIKKSKIAHQALYTLSDKVIQWNYIEEKDRQALREELGIKVFSKEEEEAKASSSELDQPLTPTSDTEELKVTVSDQKAQEQ